MKKENKPPFIFRFHNPNDDIATLELILSVFMDVNKKKADEAIRTELEKKDKESQKTDN